MGDLISRKAVLYNLAAIAKAKAKSEAQKSLMGRCIFMIESLPPIQPKAGNWLGLEADGYADGYPVYDLWECSECGEEWKGEDDTLPKYCPNCGAKMEVDT